MRDLMIFLLLGAIVLAGCGHTKRIMKNCQDKGAGFFDCEEP